MASPRNVPARARPKAAASKRAQTLAWQAWRIADGRFDPFSAVGASLVGGRWRRRLDSRAENGGAGRSFGGGTQGRKCSHQSAASRLHRDRRGHAGASRLGCPAVRLECPPWASNAGQGALSSTCHGATPQISARDALKPPFWAGSSRPSPDVRGRQLHGEQRLIAASVQVPETRRILTRPGCSPEHHRAYLRGGQALFAVLAQSTIVDRARWQAERQDGPSGQRGEGSVDPGASNAAVARLRRWRYGCGLRF